MNARLAKRLLTEPDKRALWKLAWNLGFKSLRAVRRHQRRLRRRQYFPPFFYVSVTNACRLRCQGCWVDVDAKPHHMDPDLLDRIIREAKRMGTSFFGLLGGEPLLHPHLLPVLARHPDCYFQIFTNGHLLTPPVAETMRRLGNVSPLISIEGDELVSDVRRGGRDVWRKTMDGLRAAVQARLVTGVCTSVCQSNIDALLNEAWIDRLVSLGVLVVWFYVYRPVGPKPSPELCLTAEQQRRVRQFVVDVRATKPILVIDAYHDARGRALCPSATGFAHHINPWGDVEPCPVIQFAKDSLRHGQPLDELFNHSQFLRDYRRTAASLTRGCIVLERPDALRELVQRHGARDATLRGSAMAELERLRPRPSQYDPGHEIPERNWLYRLAKRLAFHDFGAYAEHFQPENWRNPAEAAPPREPAPTMAGSDG